MHRTKSKMKSFLRSATSSNSSFFTLSPTKQNAAADHDGLSFHHAPTTTSLFPQVDPAVDGEGCDRDCASCSVSYPAKFSIDEDDRLYGHVKGWDTHLVVATGKSDWVRNVADEKGSLMQAADQHGLALKNGRCMLSASNMPTLDGEVHGGKDGKSGHTRVLVLPAWKLVEGVGSDEVGELLERVVGAGVANTSALGDKIRSGHGEHDEKTTTTTTPAQKVEDALAKVNLGRDGDEETQEASSPDTSDESHLANGIPPSLPLSFSIRSCPHRAIILMCSQKTRDARCGQSAPLLRKEFERILRPMGLYRDLDDERPGGVGIYFISHVGGHKYSANVMVYRRQGRKQDGTDEEIDGAPLNDEAVQGIWLARVRPEDCEGIIKYTVLQGKVVKPERQLRGGFDRERGLISW